MHRVRVIDVLNGNTIVVWPQWNFRGQSGNLVRIRGLRTVPEGSRHCEEARCKLMFLVLGSDVFVTEVHGCTDGVLECDVRYCGRNLTEHLREYAVTEDVVSPVAADHGIGNTPDLGTLAASLNG